MFFEIRDVHIIDQVIDAKATVARVWHCPVAALDQRAPSAKTGRSWISESYHQNDIYT
jgi:hypothetical protein